MSLRSSISAIRRSVLSSTHSRPARLIGPIVSFTFDDFPRTAWTAGGAILEKFGGRGTYYTAMGLSNSVGEEGERFRESDLHGLLENGHELASHTFEHVSARSMPSRAFEAEVDRGRAAVEVFHDAASANFAYPFGDVTLATKRIVGRSVASARGIFPGINRGEADLNLLRANSLYGDVEVLPRAQRLIRENLECAGWLIFYTHDVQPRPSRYGCTPELLEAVVRHAAESGCEILTVQQALEPVDVSNGQPRERAARSVPA